MEWCNFHLSSTKSSWNPNTGWTNKLMQCYWDGELYTSTTINLKSGTPEVTVWIFANGEQAIQITHESGFRKLDNLSLTVSTSFVLLQQSYRWLDYQMNWLWGDQMGPKVGCITSGLLECIPCWIMCMSSSSWIALEVCFLLLFISFFVCVRGTLTAYIQVKLVHVFLLIIYQVNDKLIGVKLA